MSLLLFLVKSARLSLLGALSSSVLAGVGGVLVVAAIQRALTAPRAELPRLGVEFALLSVCTLLFRCLSQWQLVRLGQAALKHLRLHMSRQLAALPYRELEERDVARLMAILTDDIGTVANFFWRLPRLFVHGAVLLGCLTFLALSSLPAFALALGVLGSGVLAFARVGTRAGRHVRKARADEDALYEHFRSLFAGAKELKLHRARREAFVSRVIVGAVEAVRLGRTRGLLIYALAASFVAFLFFVVMGMVLFTFREASSTSELRAGAALVLVYMMLPVHVWLETIPELARTRVALEHIATLTMGQPMTVLPGARLSRFEKLELREITHRYQRDGEEGTFLLGPISLALRPGELVFLVGGNGSGKTTLAKLLVGLYEPESGQIFIDGEALAAADREAYSQNFSAIFSDFYLFDSLLGMAGEQLDERARELLTALELDRKVKVRDGAFSTTELSAGQRKRLALVVACLEDRPIYVFDEWAADQDPAYKDVFYRRVLPELRARGKAVLVITHDDHYFELADRCLKLDFGRLSAHEHEPRAEESDRVWSGAGLAPARYALSSGGE